MVEKRTLYDIFEMQGIWFLPESQQKATGILRYNKGNIYLEIMGEIEKQETTVFSGIQGMTNPKNIKVIHGITSIGKYITLLDCFRKEFNFRIPGPSSSKYSALGMIVGKLIDPAKDKFNKLHTSYSNFNIWYSKTGINPSVDRSHNITISYTPVEKISVDVSSDLQLQLVVNVRNPISFYNKAGVEEEHFVTINTDTPKFLNELLDVQNCFRYFLMLAMMAPVHPRWYAGHIDGEEVEIYPKLWVYDNVPNIAVSDKMMFAFPNISADFPRIIKTWWSINKQYYKELLIYFNCILNEHQVSSELNFQTIAIALESYYRKKFPDPVIPKKKYDVMIEELLNKAEEGLQKAYIKRFKKMGNTVSLKKMLLKLVTICPETFDDEKTERENFCENVSHTRNYLSHGADELREDALEGDELYYATNQMKILIDGLLLYELELSYEQINMMMKRNRDTRNFAKQHPIQNI